MARFRAIPVFSLVVGTLVDDFGKAVSICWPWMAVILAKMGIILVTHPELAPIITGGGEADAPLPGTAWLALAVYYAVWFVALCSMAVNWHRFLLRDDNPVGWEHLRLDGKVWRYAGNTLAISLIAGLILLVFFGVTLIAGVVVRSLHEVVPGNVWGWSLAFALLVVVSFVIVLLAIIFTFRLSIKLPAIAVGDDYSLGDAWRDSRGNNFRLFGFMLLLALPALFLGLGYWFVYFALGYLAGADSLLNVVITSLVSVGVSWINMMFTLTGVALLYAVFANGAEID